jgi:uncharacterized protein DUF955
MRLNTGLAEARELAENFAAAWLRSFSVPLNAPVDVHGLAGHLGLEVLPCQMRQDGHLVLSSPPRIFVQDGQSMARQRFTVAHELAHWAVHVGAAADKGLDGAFSSEEILCNTVAGALLMPLPWIKRAFPEAAAVQRMETVRKLASRADVSLGAAVIRLRDVFGWRKTLLHWSRAEGEWIFDGEAGLYPSQQGAIVPSPNIIFTLNDVRNNSRNIQTCVLPLRIFRAERQVTAEVLPLRQGVAVLVDTPEAV